MSREWLSRQKEGNRPPRMIQLRLDIVHQWKPTSSKKTNAVSRGRSVLLASDERPSSLLTHRCLTKVRYGHQYGWRYRRRGCIPFSYCFSVLFWSVAPFLTPTSVDIVSCR